MSLWGEGFPLWEAFAGSSQFGQFLSSSQPSFSREGYWEGGQPPASESPGVRRFFGFCSQDLDWILALGQLWLHLWINLGGFRREDGVWIIVLLAHGQFWLNHFPTGSLQHILHGAALEDLEPSVGPEYNDENNYGCDQLHQCVWWNVVQSCRRGGLSPREQRGNIAWDLWYAGKRQRGTCPSSSHSISYSYAYSCLQAE